MPVEHQHILEASANHAVDKVVQHREKTAGAKRQGTRVFHMMFADARHQALCDDHAWSKPRGGSGGQMVHAPPIVLHGEMLQVLLDGGHGNNACLQFAAANALAELTPCQLA